MGTLYIVATPIGNLEDITIRAMKTLFSVDYIACEDTRKTGILLTHLEQKFTSILYSNVVKYKKPKLISYYDEIEIKRIPEIIEMLENNFDVALVSDAGTPLISDPGFKLISACIKRGIPIVSIPGPTALVSALVSSGLPSNQFLFIGYLPNTAVRRVKFFTSLYRSFHTSIKINPTIICFDTAIRLKESLADLQDSFGDIHIVIARELTKVYEEIIRGRVSECLKNLDRIKGELVILFNIPQE